MSELYDDRLLAAGMFECTVSLERGETCFSLEGIIVGRSIKEMKLSDIREPHEPRS